MQHEYSRVVFEGLRVTGSLFYALSEPSNGTVSPANMTKLPGLVQVVYDKLCKVDIDQEVKQCAILTSAALVKSCHPHLGQQKIDSFLQVFADRLNNELTRDAALKGLTLVALNSQANGQPGALIPITRISAFLPAFFDLLKKTERQLHLNTLECLEALTRRYPQ